MRALVTAGNTREAIDSVRDWGNVFTGNTGFAIAHAVAEVADVDLLTSNTAHLAELASQPHAHPHRFRITGSAFRSHAELRGALAALMARGRYDAVFMTAAVADYRPVRVYAVISREPVAEAGDPGAGPAERWLVRDVQAGKVKSTHPAVAVLGERTEKLVDLFRTEWRHAGLLVKFKLEVGLGRNELIHVAEESRVKSSADFLVANTLDMVEGERAGAYLLGEDSVEWVERAELPRRMSVLLRQWHASFPPATGGEG